MVTTVTSFMDSRNRSFVGDGYDGVVRISVASYVGTGVLLWDGRAILTAAHLFSHGSSTANVQVETTGGTLSLGSARTSVIPSYDPSQGNDDLALVWLSTGAPVAANRYGIYRNSDEIGQTLAMVGYGLPGTGDAGELSSYRGPAMRLKAYNQFDADAASLKKVLGTTMSWTPTAGSQLVADFDNGTATQDALGRILQVGSTGLGIAEGLIAPGDSGGPAFLNRLVAGIASYTTSLSSGGTPPDVDNVTNSSYGEIAAWQRVSFYQRWIDQSLRLQYSDAPTSSSQVQKSVVEGNAATTIAYFLLQFTGQRTDTNQMLSVDFSTRDGTAKAGLDYIASNGKLVLYPDETQAVIPVEIIGDTTPEPDETFYLDVTNAVGGSFGNGVIQLTAMRTILNDDGVVGI